MVAVRRLREDSYHRRAPILTCQNMTCFCNICVLLFSSHLLWLRSTPRYLLTYQLWGHTGGGEKRGFPPVLSLYRALAFICIARVLQQPLPLRIMFAWGDNSSCTLVDMASTRRSFRCVGSDCCRSALHSDYAQALSWRNGTTLISGGWDSRLCFIDLEQRTT